jgi:hypothetical protein
MWCRSCKSLIPHTCKSHADSNHKNVLPDCYFFPDCSVILSRQERMSTMGRARSIASLQGPSGMTSTPPGMGHWPGSSNQYGPCGEETVALLGAPWHDTHTKHVAAGSICGITTWQYLVTPLHWFQWLIVLPTGLRGISSTSSMRAMQYATTCKDGNHEA